MSPEIEPVRRSFCRHRRCTFTGSGTFGPFWQSTGVKVVRANLGTCSCSPPSAPREAAIVNGQHRGAAPVHDMDISPSIINHSINPSANQPINQSIHQSIDMGISPSINQSIHPPPNQPTNQPTNQSINPGPSIVRKGAIMCVGIHSVNVTCYIVYDSTRRSMSSS